MSGFDFLLAFASRQRFISLLKIAKASYSLAIFNFIGCQMNYHRFVWSNCQVSAIWSRRALVERSCLLFLIISRIESFDPSPVLPQCNSICGKASGHGFTSRFVLRWFSRCDAEKVWKIFFNLRTEMFAINSRLNSPRQINSPKPQVKLQAKLKWKVSLESDSEQL